MTQYQLTNSGSIIRLDDNMSIPNNPQNADYQQYVAWVNAGNSPIAPPTVNPNQSQINIILAELSSLDQYLPRSVEDLITALNVDVSTLPTIQQTRLAQKQTLRTQLAGLGS